MFQRMKPHLVTPLQSRPCWIVKIGESDGMAPQEWLTRIINRAGDRTFESTVQPTWSQAKRVAVVGDVWLSNEAVLWEKAGHATPPYSDDSSASGRALIATLWEQHGMTCLAALEGMFAVAIWEPETGESWFVRDRVGAYSLYYTTPGKTRWISSHLRALNPWRSPHLDLIALRDYLCCAFVPGERTLWQGVKELRPGTCLHLPENIITTYWQPEEDIIGSDESLEWHGQRLRSLLDTVVHDYLPPREPVGVYLSGGLDSSCITAFAAQFHPHPVHTYSIHFGSEYPNELEFSDLVARYYQTQHHILEISPQMMWDRLFDTMAVLDDPIGDPLTVPNRLMGEAARQDVRVILNGEGGDPCFGGPKNQPMLLTQLYSQPTGSVGKAQTANPASLSVNEAEIHDLVMAYLNSFRKCALDLPNLLKPVSWQQVKNAPSPFAADLQSNAQYLNRLMMLNIKFKGADHILTKVSNLTRAAGLIGRSPLFDQRVVAMSLEIPPAYKLAGAMEKAVLKQAVADILPDVILRRPKSGMMVPVHRWFRHEWNRQARSVLLHRKAAIAPYLNQDLIRNWLHYRGDVWGRYGVKLWLLLSLELWLQANQSNT